MAADSLKNVHENEVHAGQLVRNSHDKDALINRESSQKKLSYSGKHASTIMTLQNIIQSVCSQTDILNSIFHFNFLNDEVLESIVLVATVQPVWGVDF